MKRILFDFITLQDQIINGGMLYTQKILTELLKFEGTKIKLYGLFDKRIPIGEIVNDILINYKIKLIDIRNKLFLREVETLNIDVLFIGIAQRYNLFDLTDLKCKIYIVCHDLFDLSLKYFDIQKSKPIQTFLKRNLIVKKYFFKEFIKVILKPALLIRRYFKTRKDERHSYDYFIKLIKQDNVCVITVSEYSKQSILFFFGKLRNEIQVLYPPFSNEKVFYFQSPSKDIQALIENKKYFLLVSVDRVTKNLSVFMNQWQAFCSATEYEYYCLLIGKVKVDMKNCIILSYVNSNDLEYLYKNAFTVIYPSFIEGFGFPPIEAAAYSTPCICSNVTSIPEICGDMSIYFSPFYPEDLYRAMLLMCEKRDYYVERTKERYKEIKTKQDNDLAALIELLI